tara:strand:+ start:3725 stop:4075 length:351 start_codon:yes stop_codon:yes gene_type:complete
MTTKISHNSILGFAKINHSDAVAMWGADSLEADAALGIVRTVAEAPDRPVMHIVLDALNAFVDTLATQKDGMRVGGENPRDRLDRALAAFLEENDVTDIPTHQVAADDPEGTDIPF